MRPLERWLEHDPWDRLPAKPDVVVLCATCSARLIEPHPRLYRQLENGAPFPGCMSVCLDCQFREGVSCSAPAAKLNGGAGLTLEWDEPPFFGHVCGGRGRGHRGCQQLAIYRGPVRRCSGKEVRSA
ncbi:MAG: hypothetical protein ACTHU0_30720 [Kofleriaceae bacterium]